MKKLIFTCLFFASCAENPLKDFKIRGDFNYIDPETGIEGTISTDGYSLSIPTENGTIIIEHPIDINSGK